MDGADKRHKRLRYADDLPLEEYQVSLFHRFLGHHATDWGTPTDGPISVHHIDISPPPSPPPSPPTTFHHSSYQDEQQQQPPPPLPPLPPSSPSSHSSPLSRGTVQQQQREQQQPKRRHRHQEREQYSDTDDHARQLHKIHTTYDLESSGKQQQQQPQPQQQLSQQQQQPQQQQPQQQQQHSSPRPPHQHQQSTSSNLSQSNSSPSASPPPLQQQSPPEPEQLPSPPPQPSQPFSLEHQQQQQQPPPPSIDPNHRTNPPSPPSPIQIDDARPPLSLDNNDNDYDDVYDDRDDYNEKVQDNDNPTTTTPHDFNNEHHGASSVVVTATIHHHHHQQHNQNQYTSISTFNDNNTLTKTTTNNITPRLNSTPRQSSFEKYTPDKTIGTSKHNAQSCETTTTTNNHNSNDKSQDITQSSSSSNSTTTKCTTTTTNNSNNENNQEYIVYKLPTSPSPPLPETPSLSKPKDTESNSVSSPLPEPIDSTTPLSCPIIDLQPRPQDTTTHQSTRNNDTIVTSQPRIHTRTRDENVDQSHHRTTKQTRPKASNHASYIPDQQQNTLISLESQQAPRNSSNQERQLDCNNQVRQPEYSNQDQQRNHSNPEKQPLRQKQKQNLDRKQQQEPQLHHSNQERQPQSHHPNPNQVFRSIPSQVDTRAVQPLSNRKQFANTDRDTVNCSSSSSTTTTTNNTTTKTTTNNITPRLNSTPRQSSFEKYTPDKTIGTSKHNAQSCEKATPTSYSTLPRYNSVPPISVSTRPTKSSTTPNSYSTPPNTNMNNHTDSKQMNGSPVMTNHVGGLGDRKFSKTDSMDDNKREGPIPIPEDITSRKKNLTKEQVWDKITQAVACLKSMDEYHHGDAMKIQKAIGDVYWDYGTMRKDIGDLLSQQGYGDITVTMLKQMNSLGIFKNDDIWFPTYYTYNTCWNYSDASEVLARGLAESGAVKLMTLNLGHKPYIDNMHSKNVYYVLKASLSTLHNIARCTGVKHHFQEIKTAEVIMPLISSNDEFLKSIAMLTLAYIVEEDDNAKLIDDTNTIKNIVQWIQKALENKQKRRFRGFTPWELAQGLAKLAVNDGNKSRIVEEGALQSFLTMLRHTDPKEQATSAECIWNLAFDKTVRQRIVDHPDLVAALEDLRDNEDPQVKKNVRGALWVIKGDNDPSASVSRPHSAEATKNHIFISYSWNEKELVQKIHASLQGLGFRIWVDWEQMGGSTLQAMAEAVENSAVVLVCMSERYKQSPNCRTEAEYTFQLRKDYIPLMMQRRYRPDGWLGAILGAKLFFDFSGKHPYEKSLQGLIKELRGRGKHTSTSIDEPDGSRDGVASSSISNTVSVLGHSPPTPSGARPSSGSIAGASGAGGSSGGGGACVAMSNENVETWLVSKGLQRFTPTFSQIDGQLIWQLKKMRETAPEFYHSSLERQFGMSLIDILRFNAALDSLH